MERAEGLLSARSIFIAGLTAYGRQVSIGGWWTGQQVISEGVDP
jgi:hypothetical protein